MTRTFTAPNGRKFPVDEGSGNWIEGEIKIDFNQIVSLDLDGMCDQVSLRLTGTEILENFTYTPIGIEDGKVVLKVRGDATAIIETSVDDMPEIGDVIDMPMMGDDVRIEVAEILTDQPEWENNGILAIVDQYGETHRVEKDGESWVVAAAPGLTP